MTSLSSRPLPNSSKPHFLRQSKDVTESIQWLLIMNFFGFGHILGNPTRTKSQEDTSSCQAHDLVHEASNSSGNSDERSIRMVVCDVHLVGPTETGGSPGISITNILKKIFSRV